jgi:L-lactate dehydrogenase complex protein LldE
MSNARKSGAEPPDSKGRVALFVTCLVDLFRPRVGFAAVEVLERAGYTVEVPAQGCCGQPNFNSGDRAGAREIAAGLIHAFAEFDYVVAPSGSCAAMIRCHFPELFTPGSGERAVAQALGEKTYELTAFLHDVACVSDVGTNWPASATYHDGCAGLRELGIRQQPRNLLRSVAGLELRELRDADACCGFGGLFCVKYPDISNHIATSKTDDVAGTGADYLLSGELGCLMQMEGKLHRMGRDVRAVHIAEVLAGDLDELDELAAPPQRPEGTDGND